MENITHCKHKNTTCNISVCNHYCSRDEQMQCIHHNHNLALNKSILEEACDQSEKQYRKEASFIKCDKAHCPNHADCTKVLSPTIALSDQPLKYSEFSGYTSVISPNYITIDLHELTDVQVIQFLLWDNRGNDKQEACRREHHYRILISDYAGDLICDSQGNTIPNNNDREGLVWTVLYDSLRTGYHGWQVFNLSEAKKMRYIKLHFLSNSDHKICNLVRFEAYAKPLVGHPYNFLPTFETTISTNAITVNRKSALHHNPINRFTKEVLNRLEENIKHQQEFGALDLANEIFLFKNELQSAIDELDIYESRLSEVKQGIFKNTDKILYRAQIIKYASIALGIIGFLFNFIFI